MVAGASANFLAGATPLCVDAAPWEALGAGLRANLAEYYRVGDMHDYDQLVRALGHFTHEKNPVSCAAGLAVLVAGLAVAMLTAVILTRRILRPVRALAVSALFALHPIQAESVAYAAQRSEAIASLFYLLTLLLLDGAAAGWPGPRAWASWAGAVGDWVVGMGAKTIAISAPGAFLAGQLVVAPAGERGLQPLRRRGLRALLLAAPILALAAWSAVLHLRGFEAAPSGGAGFHETQLGAGAYFLTQLRVQWLYLGVLAWPPALAFDRSFTPSTGLDGATLAATEAGAPAVSCRIRCIAARLNESPSMPPTMARISPVRGSIATSTDCASGV